MQTNVLYYGDNLDILRTHIPSESVDLIYLDPPFNSNRSYNIIFREASGGGSEAQIEAFDDTWHWGQSAQSAYEAVMTGPHQPVARMLQAMVDGLGHNDMTAYLAMMAVRLIELRRALKPTGSIYLHCDPTASHYLKTIMDAVFGPTNFRNEIVWKRSHPKGHAFTRFASNHDVILAFARDASSKNWNQQYVPHDPEIVAKQYSHIDETGRRYQLTSLLNPNPNRPNLTYEFKGVTKVWRWTKERMLEEDAKGRIVVPRGGRGIPRYKRYLDEQEGIPIDDFWGDIGFAAGSERLGYETQKPLALLERIIAASSNPGDVVLDPFCGCGTAVHAAHKLGRQWVGIDITYLAINLIERRMTDAFPGVKIQVVGDPKDLAGARDLAARDKWQFQWWALTRLDAQPVAGRKKGADKGIDGVIPFFAGPQADYKRALVSVKGGGHVDVTMIRDLVGVLDREKEPIGVLLTLASPTRDMLTEATTAGSYHNDFWGKQYPRVQIITVEDMLNGKRPEMPPPRSPFAPAAVERERAEQGALKALPT